MKAIKIRLLSLFLILALLSGTSIPALADEVPRDGAEVEIVETTENPADEKSDGEPEQEPAPEEKAAEPEEIEPQEVGEEKPKEEGKEEPLEEEPKETEEAPIEDEPEESEEDDPDGEDPEENKEDDPDEESPEEAEAVPDETAAEIARIEEELEAVGFRREGEEKNLRRRLKELRSAAEAQAGPRRMLLRAPAPGQEKKLSNTDGVAVVSSGAAADGNYSFVLKPTTSSTVTFWSDGGYSWATSRRRNDAWKYGVLPMNGSGHAGAWVTDMGTYNGRNIDVKITYFYPDGYYVYASLHADKENGILDHYWAGIEYTARYELYLSGDHSKKVSINTGLKFLDLDFCQVFKFRNVDGVLENVSVRNDSYVYGFEENGTWTMISSGEGDDEDHQNLESQSVRFELSGVSTFDFTVSEHGFLNGYTNAIDETGAWTQSMLKAYYTNYSNLYGSHLTDDWMDHDNGSHAAFNGTGYGPWSIATPEKTVSDSDESEVTENTLNRAGEQLIYRIHQDVPNETSDAHRYAAFRFADTLPEGLTFVSQKVLRGSEDVSSHFTFSADGRKIAADAKSPADWPFYGSILTWVITAKAESGTRFVNSASVSVTKKNGAKDTKTSNEVTSSFGRKKITTDVQNGTIDPSCEAETGSDKTIRYSPDPGFHLKSVTVDGKAADITRYPSSYPFTNIVQDHEIRVVYERNTYKVTTAVEHGSIDPAKEGLPHGTNHTVNYSPDPGYRLKSVTVDGKAADIAKYPSSYPFTNISQDHEIRVVYELNTYKVSTDAVNGTIDAAKEGLPHGSDHTVHYRPDAGHHLVSLTVDGKTVDIKKYPSSYTFSGIDRDHEIRAVFEINTYRVTTGAVGGTIDPGKDAVPHGSSQTVSYRPDENCFLSEILVNGRPADPKKTPETYTFSNIEADQDIRVIYTPMPVKDVTDAKGNSLNGKTAPKGGEVTYRITSYNAGTTAKSAVITDRIPEGMEFVSADAGGVLKDGVVKWGEVQIPAGGSRTVSFAAKSLTGGRSYENRAEVTYGSDTYPTNQVVHYVLPDPVKTVSFDGADADGRTFLRGSGGSEGGTVLTYEISWVNVTKSERDYTVTDVLPKGAVFVSADHGGTCRDGAVTWTGKAAAGEQIRLKAAVRLPDNAPQSIFCNRAQLVSGEFRADTQEVVSYLAAPPVKRVRNEAGKEIDGEVIRASDILVYEIEVENPRDTDADYVITDILQDGLSAVRVSEGGSAKGQTVTWKIRVPAGESFTVSVEAKAGTALRGKKLENAADVTGEGYAAGTNTVVNYVTEEPVKRVSRAAQPGTDANGKLAAAGEQLVYAITVKNPADVEKDVRIRDILPDGVRFVSADSGGECEDYAAVWELTLSPHEERTVHFTVLVDESAKGTVLKNRAEMSIDRIREETNEVETPVPEDPVKSVGDGNGKDLDGRTVAPGTVLRYGIRFRNPGTEAKSYIITDKLPEHLVPDRISDGGKLADGTITWNCILQPGEEKEVAFTASAAGKGKAIDNQAQAAADEVVIRSNITRNGVPADPVKRVLSADGKEIAGRVLKASDQLVYTITAANPMSVEKTAVLTDVLPKGAVFQEADSGGVFRDGAVTWKLQFAPGEEKTVRVRVRIAESAKDTVLQNSAEITFDNTLPTAPVTTPVAGDPVKKVLDIKGKEIDGQCVGMGQELTYSITFRNPSAQEKVYSVTDMIPENTVFVAASDGGREANGRVLFELRLKGGEKKTVSFTVKTVKNDCVIRNSAVVMVDGVSVRTNEVMNAVPADPVKKVADKEGRDISGRAIAPGTEFFYILSVSNPFDTERDFTLTDTLPEGITFLEATDSPAAAGRRLSFSLRLKAKEKRDIRIRVKADEKSAGTTVKNRAILAADAWSGVSEEVTVYIADPPKKTVVDSEGNNRNGKDVKINAELTYRITVENPRGAKDAVFTVRDYYPSDKLEFLSADAGGKDGRDAQDKKNVTWEIPLKGGERKTVSFRVRVRNAANDEIRNRAQAVFNHTAVYSNTVVNDPVRPEEEEEDPSPSSAPSDDGEPSPPHVPAVAAAERSGGAAGRTGDKSRVLLYGGICAVSAALLSAFALHGNTKRRRKRRRHF